MSDNEKPLDMREMIKSHGVAVSGLAMLLQIAERLEGGDVSITDNARDDTLYWLAKWRETEMFRNA